MALRMPRFLVDVAEWTTLRLDGRAVVLTKPIRVQLSLSDDGYIFEFDYEGRTVVGYGDDIDDARVDFVTDFLTNLDMEDMMEDYALTNLVKEIQDAHDF